MCYPFNKRDSSLNPIRLNGWEKCVLEIASNPITKKWMSLTNSGDIYENYSRTQVHSLGTPKKKNRWMTLLARRKDKTWMGRTSPLVIKRFHRMCQKIAKTGRYKRWDH